MAVEPNQLDFGAALRNAAATRQRPAVQSFSAALAIFHESLRRLPFFLMLERSWWDPCRFGQIAHVQCQRYANAANLESNMARIGYLSLLSGPIGKTLGQTLLLISCGGCVSAQHFAAQPAPTFDPAEFFVGTTRGNAVLKIVLRRSQREVIDGRGWLDRDGSLIVAQMVQGAGAAKARTWHIHRVGPNRWSGTLSDAAGPVTGVTTGNLLHLAFAMPGGLRAQQWLSLQPGGSTVRNVMVVRKFGIPVARLDEIIVRPAN